jgi:hypothetical protein
MSYWVIAHGDPEVRIFWAGYKSEHKDHFFNPNPKNAIKFFDQVSAENAGVHLTKGIKVVEITE